LKNNKNTSEDETNPKLQSSQNNELKQQILQSVKEHY